MQLRLRAPSHGPTVAMGETAIVNLPTSSEEGREWLRCETTTRLLPLCGAKLLDRGLLAQLVDARFEGKANVKRVLLATHPDKVSVPVDGVSPWLASSISATRALRAVESGSDANVCDVQAQLYADLVPLREVVNTPCTLIANCNGSLEPPVDGTVEVSTTVTSSSLHRNFKRKCSACAQSGPIREQLSAYRNASAAQLRRLATRPYLWRCGDCSRAGSPVIGNRKNGSQVKGTTRCKDRMCDIDQSTGCEILGLWRP